VDRLSSLEVAEKLFHGANVKHRLLLIKLALNTANGLEAFQKAQLLNLTEHLKNIDLLQLLQDKIKNISEMSVMYWHRAIFSLYFQSINKQHKNFNSLCVSFRSIINLLYKLT
jgi:hypothetical protein